MLVSEYANRELREKELTETLTIVNACLVGRVSILLFFFFFFEISSAWDLLDPENMVFLNGKGKKVYTS